MITERIRNVMAVVFGIDVITISDEASQGNIEQWVFTAHEFGASAGRRI